MPMCWRRMIASSLSVLPTSDSPATDTSPSSGTSRPATMLSSVDLPQPDGPITATNSPRPISRSAPRSARTGAVSCSNVRNTWLTLDDEIVGSGLIVERCFADRHVAVSWVAAALTAAWLTDAIFRGRTGVVRPLTRCSPRSSAGGFARQLVPRGVADDDLAVGGELLQPLAQVHGVADDRVFEALVGAEQGRGDDRRVDTPMPSGNGSKPSVVHCALTADWAACIAAAATSARSAWSVDGSGAPNTAITASPTYCITVPPAARIARFISARWRLSCWASCDGSVCSLIVE